MVSDQRCRSAEEAECLATWVGLKHTLASWKGLLWLESDCFATVCFLKDPCRNLSVICHIIEEAKEVLKRFQEFRVSKCHRQTRLLMCCVSLVGESFSDVFIANSIQTCVSAALASVCNHVVLI